MYNNLYLILTISSSVIFLMLFVVETQRNNKLRLQLYKSDKKLVAIKNDFNQQLNLGSGLGNSFSRFRSLLPCLQYEIPSEEHRDAICIEYFFQDLIRLSKQHDLLNERTIFIIANAPEHQIPLFNLLGRGMRRK